LVQDVFDEASTEELQLYVIQANGLEPQEDDDNEDEEFDQFFEDARKSMVIVSSTF
jgi:hypothetical protein